LVGSLAGATPGLTVTATRVAMGSGRMLMGTGPSHWAVPALRNRSSGGLFSNAMNAQSPCVSGAVSGGTGTRRTHATSTAGPGRFGIGVKSVHAVGLRSVCRTFPSLVAPSTWRLAKLSVIRTPFRQSCLMVAAASTGGCAVRHTVAGSLSPWVGLQMAAGRPGRKLDQKGGCRLTVSGRCRSR
jgi:hypothetical protein